MGATPFGYRIEKSLAVIDQSSADQLRALFKNYLSGMSMKRAAEEAGLDFYHGTVKRLLTSRRYLGDDFYPAIIDVDTFDRTQEELYKRAVALKRTNRPTKQMVFKPCKSFSLGEIKEDYIDPKQQAEYIYSLIECG